MKSHCGGEFGELDELLWRFCVVTHTSVAPAAVYKRRACVQPVSWLTNPCAFCMASKICALGRVSLVELCSGVSGGTSS